MLFITLEAVAVTYSDISDSELDSLVKSIQEEFPNAGLVIVQGRLQSVGFQVERARIRQSLARNDPMLKFHWHQVLSCR